MSTVPSDKPLFSDRFATGRNGRSSYVERARPSRAQPTLPMFEPLPTHSIHDLPTPAPFSHGFETLSAPASGPSSASIAPRPTPPSGEKAGPRDAENEHRSTYVDRLLETHIPPAASEKGRARAILLAIRVLANIERDCRTPNPLEREPLARFGGFGPVALSIFPDPKTGGYKDEGWRAIGEELKSLLTPEEYNSAKRTTFSQFFTSPAVMTAMHDALGRLGVPEDATVLEPGCGTGAFMTGPHRYIGVELDSISGRIARALHPEADIRVENFRDTKLPPLDAVVGNVPFADIKLDLGGRKFSLHDYFIAKATDALKPGGVQIGRAHV